jgi:hypothetical protein
MDVPNHPNELNGQTDNVMLSLSATNQAENINKANAVFPASDDLRTENLQKNGLESGNMHKVVTFIVLALFSLIVVYALYKQNWWVVGRKFWNYTVSAHIIR